MPLAVLGLVITGTTAPGGIRVIAAEPDFVLSAALVAIIVTTCWLVTTAGAVYKADWPLGASVPA